MELRPYQQEAREAIQDEWQKGNKRTLLVLPTGTGKTIVFSKVIEDRVRLGERVLVLAHRGELLEQASDKLVKATGLKTATEKAEETSIGSFYRVVVGSIQTLQRDKRLKQFSADYFNSIVVDEAHHCISDGYQKVLQHFENANVLGVTATPDRSDMRNLGSYFQSLAYEYTLPAAIKEGYLTPIKALTIPLHLDLSGVKQQAGDFSTKDLGTA
ncbi:MAG: DEAD/DEAH box helicase family protein, partial [Leuconostoc mesenteroides]